MSHLNIHDRGGAAVTIQRSRARRIPSRRSFNGAVFAILLALSFGALASNPTASVFAADPPAVDATITQLAKREPLPKAPVRAIAPKGEETEGAIETPLRLIVKFRDEVLARSSRGSLISAAAVDLKETDYVAQSFGMTFQPLIQLPEESLKELEARAANRSRISQPDLMGMMVVEMPGADAAQLEAAGNALQELPEVEFVYIQALLVPPPGDIAPPTPNLGGFQNYRGPNPGLDVEYAWSLGFTGQGVRLSDCEYGWNYAHEDLVDKNLHPEPGQTIHPTIITLGYDEHGTAVLGATSGVVNGYGVSGMVPDSEVFTYPEYSAEEGSRRVTAIANAIYNSTAGDVVLLEMQTFIGSNSSAYGPAELDPAVWAVVKVGTDAGVIVVAAAGNGNQDLDGATYTEYRLRGDSGAIIVGAGTPDSSHSKLSFSTFGSRVNVQGWGQSVFTTGYGQYAAYGGDKNQRYTASFDGTSSASPMVAAAAVILQDAANKTLSPKELRELLIATGFPQGGKGGHIGPFPNLRTALDALLQPNQPPVARFTFSGSGLQRTFNASSSTDDEGIVSYRWSFPGGITKSGVAVSHFFPSYGSFYVTLTVTDTDGATGSSSQLVSLSQPTITPAQGMWYNPDRSGNGISFNRNSFGDYALSWFTYTADGTPVWYVSDAGLKFKSTWVQPLYRATWNGTSATLTQVGSVKLVFSDAYTAWFSWVLDGQAGGERFVFLHGGSGRTGAWYDPSESGWGTLVAESGGTLVAAVTFYQGSEPRWVIGQTTASANAYMNVLWHHGPGLCPSCGGSTPPTSQIVGSTTLQIADGSSTSGSQSVQIQIPGGGTWNRFNVPIYLLTEP